MKFCKFNGVDRLCQNEAGRHFRADGEMGAQTKDRVLQLPLNEI